MKVTRETIIEGKHYKARPGTEYELAKGIIGTLKEDTVALVRQVNEIERTEGGKERPMLDIAIDQAKLVLDVPKSFDWEDASPKVVWRACQDFLALTLPTERPQDES